MFFYLANNVYYCIIKFSKSGWGPYAFKLAIFPSSTLIPFFMSTQDVANRLVALCRQGQYLQAVDELYAPHIVSVEPAGSPQERTEGFEAVRGKSVAFGEMLEAYHGGAVSEPAVAGDWFTCSMSLDVTMKGQGRMQMEEVCVYRVENGKIAYEQFFFSMQ
jgi:hypothetical protein